ncbi:MAG: bifunctional 5,10-methylenetetrahydrofolate dehydrogenase/5,10-methenyltetrahydrofolate cyclohydrolase [Thermoanaerobacterales bacterium]|nr:bifunctional 5,10-methylenetetrahydrofolate dehydrogenase/5,10-methenyltetrahydrofolate cyclohydrolase [Bacillota bacterium]MDI6906772.1 bifunctional 5,10-methylenetetrahydrofolate dehydrogenase/5,10-methenyltetrahydrofolate cyclohydrolase [Thermoanaerobacterales bacterium]
MARLLDGKKTAAAIKDELREDTARWVRRGVQPKLAALLAGDDPAALAYARSKEKVCAGLGMDYEMHHLPGETREEAVLDRIRSLNGDPAVHGIILEMPLPPQIDRRRAMEAIDPLKDVDGVHPLNRGRLMAGDRGLFPATPLACVEILRRHDVPLAGRDVVLVGRGETVGKPLIFLLLQENATVTVCHTRTADLASHTRRAEVLIVAAGRRGLVTGDMVREGVTVVDAGINPSPEGRLCGDVDFEGVAAKAAAITPVPGGVGSLTTVLLLRNVLKAVALQAGGEGTSWKA